jgi:single-stranded-DNA-specific exonuclease
MNCPRPTCIVNPNQPGCDFPSKALAGVGVMFYVMLALRAELRRRGAYAASPEPNLAALLDLVALGTVADVVPLDRNNRILVAQGLARIRGGQMQPGSPRCSPSPAANRPAPPPSTSASPSARA